MPIVLEAIISPERLGPYRRAAGYNLNRAVELYAWNMKISASFMPLICAAEIGLRNLVLVRLVAVFGAGWWQEQAFFDILGGEGKGIVKRAEKNIQKNGKAPDCGRMAAELTFGFWQNMLLPKYEAQLWTPLHSQFADLPPQMDRAALHNKCDGVRTFRNRISHHEPIFGRNIAQDYSDCLELISWLSRAKATWIKPHCNVMELLRQKP